MLESESKINLLVVVVYDNPNNSWRQPSLIEVSMTINDCYQSEYDWCNSPSYRTRLYNMLPESVREYGKIVSVRVIYSHIEI